ncbi:hypothetical protein XENTR_v10018461 [Xenopus tropicalis]|uniref:BTB/POZ domain-containing protein 18 isoform X1 n=1 Tax=Xenopus tropicalis TaxID=8364 RepID=A0A8J0T2K0_XENTR|nr:BTB/POZ domain-containing protein 18 isoform X1 [Xenopus tropicalis]XP_017951394.1 BTB/POZ domain-containing protein 18 isoform X1 [Xenopus tropicalis]KAE8591480.1 hypothetical protein XENTR_v10018461 [Xenopus tropicalis]KAE8591481.1 hypothetical protein XENTR_v10018461 [Xenopus tropicalis]KAE8591482.1 hypothetical protein XENTR_v10018461 [Xenopus tropicalis]|eukprot:XP_017951392.1 PREDICTED: BTB/POZ domain-containing protein 18 isoform X1 [Xenopus tropicalis]
MASTVRLRYWNPRLLRTMFLQLQRQQNTGFFCDVTLQGGEGEGVSVHACLLAACSPYLAKLLASVTEVSQLDTDSAIQTDCTGHILTVPGIPSCYLLPLVHYMYTSELEVTPENVHGVLEAARRLQIPELEGLRLEGGRLVRPELARKLNRDCFGSVISQYATESGNGKQIFTKEEITSGRNVPVRMHEQGPCILEKRTNKEHTFPADTGSLLRGKMEASSSLQGNIENPLLEITKNPTEKSGPSTVQTCFQSRENYECAFQDSGTTQNVSAINQDIEMTKLSSEIPLIVLNPDQKRHILVSEHGADTVPSRKTDMQDKKLFKLQRAYKVRKETGEQATKGKTNIIPLSRIIKLDRGEKQDMPQMDENIKNNFKHKQNHNMNSNLNPQDSVLKQVCRNKNSQCTIKLELNDPSIQTQSHIQVCPEQQRIVQSHLEENAALQKDVCVTCVIAKPMANTLLQHKTVKVVKLQHTGSNVMNTKKILLEERDMIISSQKRTCQGIKRDWCADEFEDKHKELVKRSKTENGHWWEEINEVESPAYALSPNEQDMQLNQPEELVEQILSVSSPSSSEVDVGGQSPVPTKYVGVRPDSSSESDTEIDIL